MREDWSFRWKSPGDRFRAVFDVFCQRWNICGMERGKPLLLKFTANLTPSWHDDLCAGILELRSKTRYQVEGGHQIA